MTQDTKAETKAFTLIEILIVAGIVLILAVAGIPSISQFGKRADFENRKYEIESIVSQVGLKAKNPDKGYDRYQAVVDTNAKTVRLERKKGSETETVKQISLNAGQTVAYANYANIYCKTADQECGHFDAVSGDIPLAPGAAEKFVTLSDSSAKPALSAEIWIKIDPFSARAK